MAELACPECGFAGVRRSHNPIEHWVRLLLRDSRRYCPNCSARWKTHHYHGVGAAHGAAAAAVILSSAAVFASLRASRARPIDVRPASGGGISRISSEPSRSSLQTDAPGPASAARGGTSGPEASGRAFAPASDRTGVRYVQMQDSRDRALTRQLALLAASLGLNVGPGATISQSKIDQLLKENKKQLWNEYGQYFFSKEQAQQFYNQVKTQRDQGKNVVIPAAPPSK